jgi:hypothetical protein
MKYYIYGLVSTRDEKIRYVGQTKSPLRQRLAEHRCDSLTRKNKNHKCNWYRKECRDGYDIKIVLIEETDKEHWAEREIYWIKKLSVSNDLVNELKGGNCGGVGGKLQNYLTYSEAKKYIKKYMPYVKTYKEYVEEYVKNYEKHKNFLPKAPQKVYSLRNEWVGWGDYLSNGTVSAKEKHHSFITYERMKELNIKNNIKTLEQYKKFIKQNNINAPLKPQRGYSDKWISVYDFLGIKEPNICTYKEFCDIMVSFLDDLKNEYSYRKLYKNKMLPDNMPCHPIRVYKKKWEEIVSDIKNK